MPKYRDYVRKMFDDHEKVFADFAQVHAQYALDQATWQSEFNRLGAPVADILREYEQRLCGHSEKGNFAKYSANLAEKFRIEVKAFFPLVDFIGAKTKGNPVVRPAVVSQPAKPVVAIDKDIAEIDALNLNDFDIPKLF